MHGEWVMLWVAAMYNVVAILSMADMICLACMEKLWSAWAALGLNSMLGGIIPRMSNLEVYNSIMSKHKLDSIVYVGKMAQDVGMAGESVVVSVSSSLVGFFEGSIPTCACFHSENILWLVLLLYSVSFPDSFRTMGTRLGLFASLVPRLSWARLGTRLKVVTGHTPFC